MGLVDAGVQNTHCRISEGIGRLFSNSNQQQGEGVNETFDVCSVSCCRVLGLRRTKWSP